MRRIRTLVALTLILPALAADWPQLLGPTRNGVSAEKLNIALWKEKGPPVVWQRDIGVGYSSPVVADGLLYLFHRVEDDEVLEALEAKTGKGRWKASYKSTYEDDYGK